MSLLFHRKQHAHFPWQSFMSYAVLILFLIILGVLGSAVFRQNPKLLENSEFQVSLLGLIVFVGFFINRIAPKTIVPSFVWVIFAGMALQPFLSIFTEHMHLLTVTMEIFASIILFAGGLNIRLKSFQKWFFPILILSLLGVFLTAIMFSFVLYGLSSSFGILSPTLLPSIVILSFALASTDPTAIIPMLKNLNFKREFVKQIAVSESALTDVSGSIFTKFLLAAFLSAPAFQNNGLAGYFSPLFRKSTYDAFALQIMTGILVGYLGFVFIKSFYNSYKLDGEDHIDPALLIAVPIFTYSLGSTLAGAGFLAAFIAGLLSDLSGELKKASSFYEDFLDHLVNPFIFIILGALIPVGILIQYAPIGILAALVFIIIIRPLVVFISLLPWLFKHKFVLEDLLFLSFVRETGIIAAILLIIASSNEIIQSDFVIAVGMWIILITLVVEPPLTPLLAKKIGMLEKPVLSK
jgi:cell volume regulation protein A